MVHCTIFLPAEDSLTVTSLLQQTFAGQPLSFYGPSDQWENAIVRRKLGWFKRRALIIQYRPAGHDEFASVLTRAMNLAGPIRAHKPNVQEKLMTIIQNTKLSLVLIGTGGVEVFKDDILRFLEAVGGYALIDNTHFIDNTGQLVLNDAGESAIDDLPVPDAFVQLGQADQRSPHNLYESQVARKNRSMAVLRERGVPVIEHLPCIIADEELQPRTKQDIVQRTIALAIVAVKAEGLEDAIVQEVIRRFDAAPFFSPVERAFIDIAQPTDDDRLRFVWRYESLWVLLWALSFVDDLAFPDQICDVPATASIIQRTGDYASMLAQATLRSPATLLDQADITYRLDWACVNARVMGQPAPAGLNASVVYERHYAFNWLTRYMDQPWDEVRTDT
ncbi:DUF4272 domain-containing protein [Fibrisoma montanum]|nr:DUF4272 domain-containing protein [Fibrisoma montanum]